MTETGVRLSQNNGGIMSYNGLKGEEGVSPYRCEVKCDQQGRIVGKRESVDGMSHEYEYIYDEADRLYSVRRDGVGVEQYLYDSEGRRRSEYNSLRDGLTRGYHYSGDNRLLKAGDVNYHHDGLGFRFAKSVENWTWRYWYSPDYKLLRVNLPEGGCVEYSHDDEGRRIVKTVDGKMAERYQWKDKTTLIGFHDGMLWADFDYGRERMPHSMYRNGQRYTLHYDQVGTLRLVSDVMGNVIKRIDYDSFGNILDDTNPSFKVPFGFAGGLHDRDTGLIRFGWRDYDPDTGRWTAKDPIGYAGGDNDLYGYCLDDPINAYDPDGRLAFLLPFALGMGGATALGGLGAWGAAKAADWFGKKFGDEDYGKDGKTATAGVKKAMGGVAGINTGMIAAAATPYVAKAAVPYAVGAGKAAYDVAQRHGNTLMRQGRRAMEALERRTEPLKTFTVMNSDKIQKGIEGFDDAFGGTTPSGVGGYVAAAREGAPRYLREVEDNTADLMKERYKNKNDRPSRTDIKWW